MDSEKFFKYFTHESIDSKSDDEIEKEIMQSAHYNLRMFVKCVTNSKNFQLKLMMLANKKGKDISKIDQDSVLKIEYSRAFNFIQRVNIYDKEDVLDMDLLNPYDLGYCVKILLEYYLKYEDYQRVGYLHELLTFIEDRYADID